MSETEICSDTAIESYGRFSKKIFFLTLMVITRAVSTGARSFFLGKLSFLCSIRILYWFNCRCYSYWDITCFLKKIRFFFIFFLFPASFSYAFLCQTSFIYIQIYSKFSAEFEFLVEKLYNYDFGPLRTVFVKNRYFSILVFDYSFIVYL